MAKKCFYCGAKDTKKRGWKNGVQQWYCKVCKRYFTGRGRVTSDQVNAAYAQGNFTIDDLGRKFGVSSRTIYRHLCYEQPSMLPLFSGRKVVVLMDATYWGRKFGVVIMKDAIMGDVLWHKFINKKETLADYREGIEWIEAQGLLIQGIVSDGLRGLREQFPQYKFQLCQFHQIMIVRTRLTANPRLQASQELLEIAKSMCRTDKETFIGALDRWYVKWEDFLKERTVGIDGKTHYVHKRTRSAFLSLRRNMEWLWTWYDNPELCIPNTNNALEALNSVIKRKLNLHKGISEERRKMLISELIIAHNPSR